jgi:superkiller protein 3
VIKLDPKHLLARNTLARRLEEMNNNDELVVLCDDTVKAYPDSPEARYFLAKGLLKNHQISEAIRQLQEAVRLNPDFQEAHYHLGLALERVGTRQDAAIHQQKASELTQQGQNAIAANVRLNTATEMLRRGEIDPALHTLEETALLEPNWPDVHWRMGNALMSKEQTEKAIAEFKTALQLEPNYFEALYDLGVAYSMKRDWDHAAAPLRKAIELRPSSAQAHWFLGAMLLRQENIIAAIQELQQAATLDPSCAEAHYQLGVAYRKSGNTALADAEFTRMRSAAQRPPDELAAAKALEEGSSKISAGDLDAAITQFKQAVKLSPKLNWMTPSRRSAAQTSCGRIISTRCMILAWPLPGKANWTRPYCSSKMP